jgi:hypothetical protein
VPVLLAAKIASPGGGRARDGGWNHAAKLLFSGMTRVTLTLELPVEPDNPLQAGILHAPMTGARAKQEP